MLGRRRNNRRIYLAFSHTPGNPITYHTAFLVTPKRSNTTSEAKNSRIFHVRRDLSNGREARWIFDPKPTRTRSYLLASVMLLHETPAETRDVAWYTFQGRGHRAYARMTSTYQDILASMTRNGVLSLT